MKIADRLLLASVWILLCSFAVADDAVAFAPFSQSPDEKKSPRIVSRFRLGPFYESARTDDGAVFRAVRPFYSSLCDARTRTEVQDLLWPLCTRHSLRDDTWWRAGVAYGYDRAEHTASNSWSFNVFPLWFSGRDRVAGGYAALFPVGGYLPHTLFVLDDVHFAMFPLYLDYKVNGARRNYWLWPLLSSSEEIPGEKRHGVFPLYGSTERRGSTLGSVDRQRYVLWPLWNDARYESSRNPGSSWMLWPLYGSVNRSNEQQRLFLPPFFSWTKTDSGSRLRCPWPLLEIEKSKRTDRLSIFPLYGDTRRKGERKRYFLWPFFSGLSLETEELRTDRFQFFPFYTRQRRSGKAGADAERTVDSFVRVWPFFSRETRADGSSHLRALDLIPIRNASGVDRNWAPFWTLFTRTEKDGEAHWDILWGLIKFTTETEFGPTPETIESVKRAAAVPIPEEPLLQDLREEVK